MNKLVKKSLIALTFFFLMFVPFIKIDAYWITQVAVPTGISSNFTYSRYAKSGPNASLSWEALKSATTHGVYYRDGHHVYCLEPATKIGNGFTATEVFTTINGYADLSLGRSWYKPSEETMKKIILVLSYAYYDKNYSQKNISQTNIGKIMAAQHIIWELISGERIDFNSYAPNGVTSPNSYYNRFIGSTACQATACNSARSEYKRLIDKAWSHSYIPNKFSTGALANSIPLNTYSNNGYSTTIVDKRAYVNGFQYFRVKDASGLKVSIAGDGSSITITSPTPIEGTKTITLERDISDVFNGTTFEAYVEASGAKCPSNNSVEGCQNVGIGADQRYVYLKVYTPKYQLKVIKTTDLDNSRLSGVKFNVCSDSLCKNVLDTITTDKNGEAVYKEIKSPGTYYIKEIGRVDGHVVNSAIKPVVVPASAVAGGTTYGSLTIKNIPSVAKLEKYTEDEKGNRILITDYTGKNCTGDYLGPEFEISTSGKKLYFKEESPGKYVLSSDTVENSTSTIRTCNGTMSVKGLKDGSYKVSETKALEGTTLDKNPNQTITIKNGVANRVLTFYNGVTGLIFEKRDEDGNLLTGGKFAIQVKQNNVYKDVLLREIEPGTYEYVNDLKDSDKGATYVFLTDSTGVAQIKKLPPGEYRIVEKEAPEGYVAIKDKDSKALVTINDTATAEKDFYQVSLINQKEKTAGSDSFAEFIVTITTGRKVPNYVFIISGLVVLLIAALVIRKKAK